MYLNRINVELKFPYLLVNFTSFYDVKNINVKKSVIFIRNV